MNIDIHEQMTYVGQALKAAGKYGLEVEMVTWALKAMKKDNTITIEQAISDGMSEWDL